MENIEAMANELIKPDIEAIKADRKAYIKERVTKRGLRAKLQRFMDIMMSPTKYYKCNACEAVVQADHPDGKYCPACRGSDLNVITFDELAQIAEMRVVEDEAQIKELRSQKLSKKAIADKLGIRTSWVSAVVGIKKRKLPKEKIDYIRNEYLLGHSEWEIKSHLGHISVEKVSEVTGDLCQEIMKAYNQGILPEDIGNIISIHGHNQAIIDIVNRFIRDEMYVQELRSKPLEKSLLDFD
jgi:hypothetical protein